MGGTQVRTNSSYMPECGNFGGVGTIRYTVKNIEQEYWVYKIHYTSEDSKVIVCDRCEGCTCTDCLNISHELYRFIGKNDVVNDILDVEKKHMKGLSNLPITQDTNKTSENKALQTIAERLDRLEKRLTQSR